MPDDEPAIFDPVEDRQQRTPREVMTRYGYMLLPSSELSDCQLPGRVRELLDDDDKNRTNYAKDKIPPKENPISNQNWPFPKGPF